VPQSLTAEQRNRYQRHILLPEVDVEGQLKLLDSKVLLLGAGGLGSPAALYLAAAGVGTIGIIDMDVGPTPRTCNARSCTTSSASAIARSTSAKKTISLIKPRCERRDVRRPPRRRQT